LAPYHGVPTAALLLYRLRQQCDDLLQVLLLPVAADQDMEYYSIHCATASLL
jgi:hypothetical protein